MFGLACDAVGRLRLDSFDMTEPHVQIRSDVDDSAVTDNAVSVVGLSAMGMSELGATAVAGCGCHVGVVAAVESVVG